MKRLVLLLLVCFSYHLGQAQSPSQFSYQAILRNAQNELVINKNIAVKCSLIQGTTDGLELYVEEHTVATNDNGLFTLSIGNGSAQNGNLEEIDWTNGPFYLKTEIDPEGSGNNYSLSTTSQLLSVPFAIHSHSADTIISPSGKGLSTEDFTTEAKNKLEQIDGSETHLKAGKGIDIEGLGTLEKPYAISMNSQALNFPIMSSEEIDTMENVSGGKLVFNKSIQALQVFVDSIPGFSFEQDNGGQELSLYGGYMRAQSFKIDSANHNLFYFRFYVTKVNSPGGVDLELRESSPDGKLVLSKSINVENPGWHSTLFVTPSKLKTGTYAIDLNASTADLMLDTYSKDGYTGGSMYFLYGSTTTSGTWKITTGYDLRFKLETPGQNSGWKILNMSE